MSDSDNESGSAPVPGPSPDLASEHPLQHTWTVWEVSVWSFGEPSAIQVPSPKSTN